MLGSMQLKVASSRRDSDKHIGTYEKIEDAAVDREPRLLNAC